MHQHIFKIQNVLFFTMSTLLWYNMVYHHGSALCYHTAWSIIMHQHFAMIQHGLSLCISTLLWYNMVYYSALLGYKNGIDFAQMLKCNVYKKWLFVYRTYYYNIDNYIPNSRTVIQNTQAVDSIVKYFYLFFSFSTETASVLRPQVNIL